MEVSEKFSQLKFPVHKLAPNTNLEKELPRLFFYREFQNFKHEHKDKIIRYICFLYDPGSDLIEEFSQDYTERKYAAATAAGIERIGDKWPKWFELVLSFQKNSHTKVKDGFDEEGNTKFKTKVEQVSDEPLLMMILRFIRLFNNRVWTEICSLEVELERFTKQRWEGLGVDDPNSAVKSAELAKICDSHIAKLNSLYNEFLLGDKDLEKEVIEMITPENMDRLLQSA